MSKQIAREEKEVMNSLFASEYGKMATVAGLKTATSKTDIADDNGKEQGPQAFSDHDEYLEVLTSVLNEDTKQSFDPNGMETD